MATLKTSIDDPHLGLATTCPLCEVHWPSGPVLVEGRGGFGMKRDSPVSQPFRPGR